MWVLACASRWEQTGSVNRRSKRRLEDPRGTIATGLPKKRMKWWQRLALLGFSFILLVLMELALRVVGYGSDPDLMVRRAEVEGGRIIGLNPVAWKRFALRPTPHRPGEGVLKVHDFRDPKPPGIFRVFFLGESSVQGVPYERNATMCAFLEALLAAAWPEIRVEVINCGVTAVNSYSLRAWLPEVLEYEPDLLVVYAGHNEFYGFYGPGSLHGVGTSRKAVLTHMWIRQLRLSQVIRDGLDTFRSPPPPESAATLMEMMAKDRLIRLGSGVYSACRENFRANLNDMVQAAQGAGVPMVLCGLVSNERDLVPMVSANREGLSRQQEDQWRRDFQEGAGMVSAGRWGEALPLLERAAQIDDTHAELIYRLAQCRQHLGQPHEARALYRRARDLDCLRFRATGEFSEVIRSVTGKRCIFVDTAAAFEAASPDGLIGWNLMTDHLHPTVYGHYLIARSICHALAAECERLGLRAIEPDSLPQFERAAEVLGCDQLTELIGSLHILKLMQAYPFAGTPNAARAAELLTSTARDMASLPQEIVPVIDQWIKGGSKGSLHFAVARLYESSGQTDKAMPYLRRAERTTEPHSPEAVEIKLEMARFLAASTRPEDAERAADYAQQALQYVEESARVHPEAKSRLAAASAEIRQMIR